MRKWILVAVGLIALAIGLAVVAVMNLEGYLNRNREWLAQRAEQALGRRVTFGEIGVSVLGGVGVRIDDLAIADDPRFSDQPVVRADSALVRVRVLPALFGRYEVARVVLEAPAIDVIRTADGLNLATLGKPATADGSDAEGGGAGPTAFVIAVVDVDDGRLLYVDRTAKPPAEVTLEQIDFSASDVSLDDPMSFELTAAALGAREQNVRAEGTVGPLGVDDPSQMPLDVHVVMESLSVDDLARIREVAEILPTGLAVSGPLTFSARAEGTVGTLAITARLDGDDANVRYAETLDKPAGVPLNVDVRARQGTDGVAIENAFVRLDRAELNAKGTVAAGESSAYDLAVTSNAVPLPGWDRLVPALEGTALEGTLRLDIGVAGDAQTETPVLRGTITLDDFGARREGVPSIADLSTTATLQGDAATIAPATFLLGGAPATLTASVTNLTAPTIAFEVASDAMPAAALGAASDDSAREEVLRNLAVDGTARPADAGMDVRAKVTSASGVLRGVEYQDLSADVRLEGGRAVLDPISLRAFGGSVRGEGVYDMREEPPAFNFDSQVKTVRIGDALATFGGASARILEGTFDADLKLAGVGNDWETISQALTGGGGIGLKQGALKNINLVDDVLESLTGVPGLSSLVAPDMRTKYPRLFASSDTVFDALEGRFAIADGKLLTDNLAIRAAEYLVSGRGGIGLDKSVDLSAGLELSSELSKDLISRVEVVRYLAGDNGRVYVPFRLEGTLPAARPRPDVDYVAHALQRAAVRGFVDGIIDGAKKKGQLPPPAESGAEDEAVTPDAKQKRGAQTPAAKQKAPATPSGSKPRGADAPKSEAPPPDGAAKPMSPEEQMRRGLDNLFGR